MNRRRAGGFTLVEVLVAILIVAVVAMVLLQRRVEVVRDAARLRGQRIAWILASLKMGLISQNPATILPADSGDFSKDAPDQTDFRWSYEMVKVPIPLGEPEGEPPRELQRLHLKIFDPEGVELQSLEALYPVIEGDPATGGSP